MKKRLLEEIQADIKKLEDIITEYGSFNVIGNAIAKLQMEAHYKAARNEPEPSPVIPEYIALICLKFPNSLGYNEFTRTRSVAEDMHNMVELAKSIIGKYTFIHYGQFDIYDEKGGIKDMPYFAQTISADELLVRNETFESYHWDLLEGLYAPLDQECTEILGFTIDEAIRICMTIADFTLERIQKSMNDAKAASKQMYDEVIAYKYRKIKPKQFYPQEVLDNYTTWKDEDIKFDFMASMFTYQMVMYGHTLSFTAKDIVEMEDVEEMVVEKFLALLSLHFGDINPDFSRPEIMHPLKDKPLVKHEDRYICPSLSLLDYSLDRLFHQRVMIGDPKKSGKRLNKRHDYLVEEGVKLFRKTLNSDQYYLNLKYPGGEMDGLVICDNNVFFIEGKGHTLSDRARKGFIDRIETHIEAIVKESHEQALRSFNYLFGKKDVAFTDSTGKKVVIDGSQFKQAYFVSLTIENLKSISCNLKVSNTLGLFTAETFPWLISLYDLRTVCEHMEGPAYFIQYIHRRREFFKHTKFVIQDEVDLLGYYLHQNLRFDSLMKREDYANSSFVYLDSYLDRFNKYYFYKEGKVKKEVRKMVYNADTAVKALVKTLEDSGLPNAIDAVVQVLEFGSRTKDQLMEYIKLTRKRQKKDNKDHDFRILGDDVDGKTWMFSYMLSLDEEGLIEFFDRFVEYKFKEEPHDTYFALLDTGKTNYNFKKITYLQRP
ncbi:MAG: hypothetical protein HYU71_15660 [Bacteroidetes bacterium]|nr:hypothetical protein [Bacteroidota bacterium]